MQQTGKRESWLVSETGISNYVLCDILRGRRLMTNEIATKLSAVTGLSRSDVMHLTPIEKRGPLNNVIYPNIREWLISNKRSIRQMAKDLGRAYGSVYGCITSFRRPQPISERIAAYVGMTEDEAFFPGASS